MESLINQLVAAAVSKVPADIRQAEADTLRASMQKARAMLGAGNSLQSEDTGWTERVLRRMGEQYTTWRGQNQPQKASKR